MLAQTAGGGVTMGEVARLIVAGDETFPRLIQRLKDLRGQEVVLEIPAESPLFLTASEFRAVKSAAEQFGILLSVASTDRLRRHLAAMFEITIVSVAAPPPPKPPSRKAALPPKPPVPEPGEEFIDEEPEPRPENAEAPEAAPPRSKRGMLIGAGASGLVLVIALLLSMAMRTATIVLTMARTPVTTSVQFAAVGPGGEAPAGALYTVPAEPVSISLSVSVTLPVTGALREPISSASGEVQLRNPGSADVAIPAGEQFTDRLGVVYAFPDGVTVPAANGDREGQASARIAAVTPGEAGNRESGTLSGRLPNGVYYMNRNAAVAGGEDRKTPIVDPADHANLLAAATAEIARLAETQPYEPSRMLIPGSVQVGELSATFDRQIGEQVSEVTVVATAPVAGLAFSVGEAQVVGIGQLQTDLKASVPLGSALVESSVSVGSPEVVTGGANAALFRITATAEARADLNSEQERQLAEQVAGKSESEARSLIGTQPNVAAVEIMIAPGFLPGGLPGSAGRIEVEEQ